MEQTYIMIKPDGVQRGLVGEILGRFERKGFTLVGMKQLTPSRELAEQHYGVHKERPFFGELVEFMTSGPVVLMVLERENAIQTWRDLMGPTDSTKAGPDTVRGQFGTDIGSNASHGSDAPETAAFETAYFYSRSKQLKK